MIGKVLRWTAAGVVLLVVIGWMYSDWMYSDPWERH